jgi:hypothetical protein
MSLDEFRGIQRKREEFQSFIETIFGPSAFMITPFKFGEPEARDIYRPTSVNLALITSAGSLANCLALLSSDQGKGIVPNLLGACARRFRARWLGSLRWYFQVRQAFPSRRDGLVANARISGPTSYHIDSKQSRREIWRDCRHYRLQRLVSHGLSSESILTKNRDRQGSSRAYRQASDRNEAAKNCLDWPGALQGMIFGWPSSSLSVFGTQHRAALAGASFQQGWIWEILSFEIDTRTGTGRRIEADAEQYQDAMACCQQVVGTSVSYYRPPPSHPLPRSLGSTTSFGRAPSRDPSHDPFPPRKDGQARSCLLPCQGD